jgi:hypothetical protein
MDVAGLKPPHPRVRGWAAAWRNPARPPPCERCLAPRSPVRARANLHHVERLDGAHPRRDVRSHGFDFAGNDPLMLRRV